VWWRELGHALLDLTYPPRCGGCDRTAPSGLCELCRSRLKPVERLGCQKCGVPAEPGARALTVCPRCQGGRGFELARAPYVYRDPLRHALRALKFSLREPVAGALADLLVESVLGREESGSSLADLPFAKIDLVCPVPLHPARERRRGFNQSDLLARPLAEALRLAYDPRLLVRIRETKPQFGLSAPERVANVERAFGHFPGGMGLERRRVLLVDDLVTTGATVSACAEALRAGGAAAVWALSLCRTPPGEEGIA
jgi:competence protein ComFC